jgi:hypothetical protein
MTRRQPSLPCKSLINRVVTISDGYQPPVKSRVDHWDLEHPHLPLSPRVKQLRQPPVLKTPSRLRNTVLDTTPLLVTPVANARRKFQQRKVSLALQLYAEFNRIVFDDRLPLSLKLEWSNTLHKTAGKAIVQL